MIPTPSIRPTLRRGMRCVAIPALLVLAASAATAQTLSGGTGIDGPIATPVPTSQVGGSGSSEDARNTTYRMAQNTSGANVSGSDRTRSGGESSSWLPYTGAGYVGLNIGKPRFKTACGSAAFSCDDGSASVYLYTGGLFNDWVGAEVGYYNSGNADRAGGQTRAQGVNLSLVARAPIGPLNAFIKGGAMYGHTRVSSALLSGVESGKRRGWGASYGGGFGFDVTPRSGIVLEWSRLEFRFPGNGGRQHIDNTSLGYVHRF